MRSAINTFKAI